MRKITYETVSTGDIAIITDWDLKTWKLFLTTSGEWECSEIEVRVSNPHIFIQMMYGHDEITQIRGTKFRNYTLELVTCYKGNRNTVI